MILYHGTAALSAMEIGSSGIRLDAGKAPADFGRGFYLTPDRSVAFDRKKESALAYFLDLELPELRVKRYSSPDDSWCSEVYSQRVLLEDVSSGFDVVIGPIADGKMGRNVRKVRSGKMSKKEFIQKIRGGRFPSVIQVAVKTERGLAALVRRKELDL